MRGPAKNTYNARYCSVLGGGGAWNHWASRRDNNDPEYFANKCFSIITNTANACPMRSVWKGSTADNWRNGCNVSIHENGGMRESWQLQSYGNNLSFSPAFHSLTNGIDYWLRNVRVGDGTYFGLITKAGVVTGGGAADQGGFHVSTIPCFSIG